MNPAYGLISLHGAQASEASVLFDHDESVWRPFFFFRSPLSSGIAWGSRIFKFQNWSVQLGRSWWVCLAAIVFPGRLYQAGLHGAAASLSSRTEASNLVDPDESIWRPLFFFFFRFFLLFSGRLHLLRAKTCHLRARQVQSIDNEGAVGFFAERLRNKEGHYSGILTV